MANSYTKSLTLNLRTLLDRNSVKEVEEQIDDVKRLAKIKWIDEDAFKQAANKIKADFNNLEIVKQGLIQGEDLERVRQAYQEQQEALAKIEILKKEIAEIEMFDKDNENLDKLKEKLDELQGNDNDDNIVVDSNDNSFFGGFKDAKEKWANRNTFYQKGKDSFDKMVRTITEWKDKALKAITDFVKDAIEELKSMASWDIRNSTTYNRQASDMYMSYGLQGADAYAMSRALEATNIPDIETYLTDPIVRGNEALLEAFNEQYEIAKAQYEEDVALSKELQEFQKEYELFRKEMQKEVIDFFMKNKDTIMNILYFLMDALQTIVDIITSIVNFFTGTKESRTDEQRQSDLNEILGVASSNNDYSNNSKNVKVNVNNTYNGVGKTDQGWLQNVGQMTYQQIIEYLGRE